MAAQAMPAEHAILGLLDLDDGHGHGYDLARHFADGQPLADVLHLEPGMLYHHLKKLERNRWVESTLEPQATRPARQVYRLTDEGRAELCRWLTEPVQHTREIRIEFLVKLFFARRSEPDLAESLIAGQLEACRQWEATLLERLDRLDLSESSRSESEFAQIVLELRIAQTRAAIDWLQTIAG